LRGSTRGLGDQINAQISIALHVVGASGREQFCKLN
jgi:hypothetical protein